MMLSISSLDPYGMRVEGLQREHLACDRTRALLHDLWIEHGLLVLAGCDLTPEDHIGLSGIFGELLRHPIPEVWVDGHPELVAFRTGPDDEYVYEVNGVERAGWIPWHSDQSFMPRKNRGGVLRSVRLPGTGGETGFLDTIALYEALSPELKRRIDGLEVVYRLCPNMAEQPYASAEPVALKKQSAVNLSINDRIEKDYPPVVHAMVIVHPETGRKALNLSPNYSLRVLGMSDEDSDALLRELTAHVFERGRPYVHRWSPNEMVAWDNWRTLHMAAGTAPGDEREVHRTTIAGDYRWGRLLQAS